MEDITKTIMFTTNAIQNATPIQYQTAEGILKQPKIEGQKTAQEFPTFCYTTTNANTVNLAQITDDNKTCYVAQPIGNYNYALVNQMQLAQNGAVTGAIATLDNQGRLQIVNKPIAVNTISNISFKCDVCGLIFSHLTLLNHHKRIHNQDGNDNQQSDAITVVANGQNIVQTQNIVNENGQSLGQIQIVATEALEPATQQALQAAAAAGNVTVPSGHTQEAVTTPTVTMASQQQNTQAQATTATTVVATSKTKCISCGNLILLPAGRRKNAKIRCENCIRLSSTVTTSAVNNNATVASNVSGGTSLSRQGSTQIFVAPDGDVKFEIPQHEQEIESLDPLNEQTIKIHEVEDNTPQQNNAQYAPGHHPVKRRNLATVTKCQKCNGTGVIFIGGGQKHVKTEQPKPFTCNICGGTFSRYSSLWSHKKLHSGEKNYKCSICGLAFAKAVYLKNHSRIHTGEKPYKCQTCGMQFSQSPHLKNHERTHSGEKPYVCEVCDKGFARHATLWNHRRIHTGEKPYKCETCGSAFSQAAHLKNHAKVHSGEKPFKCDICSAAFADRFALKRHRGIHEKYGQIAPKQESTVDEQHINDEQQIGQMIVIQKEEVPEIDDETEPNEIQIVDDGGAMIVYRV